MNEGATPLPDDIDALKALVQRQTARLAQHTETITQLQEQVRLLLARRFGASSERLADDSQLGLFNEAEVEAHAELAEPETVEVPAHRRRRGGRAPLPAALPRVELIHELPEAEQRCPHDGTTLTVIGEETAEQLDIIPATVQVLRHRRLKYACPCCQGHVSTAPMPAQPLPKSLASPGLLAYVATAKFVDALPLYRQAKQFERLGVELHRSTLGRWMVQSGTALVQPLINLLRDELLAQDYLQMDETTVQVLKESGKAAQSTSYLWAQRSLDPTRPIVLFDYDPSRSGDVPKRLLGEFAGTLQTDGYTGYSAVVNANGINQLYCFAHARRRFTDVLKSLGMNPNKPPDKPPDRARRPLRALSLIRTLYTIERRIREEPPDVRYRVRQAESRPVLEKLHAWLEDTRPKVAPKTKLGEALAYLDHHWVGLVRYCDDGRFEIDTNATENAIRPFCLGRRNWLFCDTVAGAKASANLYSLIQTAKANGVEPYAYLRHIFAELPKATTVDDVEALLPYNVDLKLLSNPAP